MEERTASEGGSASGPGAASDERAPTPPMLARYMPILESMVDGVMVADPSAAIVFANEAAARIFGVPRDELLVTMQAYPERFALRAPDGGPQRSTIGERALTGEIVEPVERIIQTPDGADKHLRTSAAPIRDENGLVIGAVILIADVTAEKSAEAHARQYAEDLRKAYEDAQSAIRERDEVLSVVSHDLRSPLGAVTMATSTIVRMAPDEKLRKAAGHAYRAAQHMGRLIDDLLTVARARGGKLTLELAETSPDAIVEELVDTFEQVARQRRVELRREPPAASRPISCDGVRVVEALSNFVSNALEITPAGGAITLGATEAGDEVVFSVRDTGPGIDAADLPRIFDRYYRAPGVTYQGTGLGLAIAKAIAVAHGGRVWAESQEGSGSAFFLALPARAPAG